VSSWLWMRPFWIPVAFAIVLAGVGRSTYRAVEESARVELATKLETILNANSAAVDVWLVSQYAIVGDLAADPELRAAVSRLDERLARGGPAALRDAPAQSELNAIVPPILARHGYLAWRVYDLDMVCLAGSDPEDLGRVASADPQSLARVRSGETFVTPPLVGQTEDLLAAPQGFMAIFTPLLDAEGRQVAILAVGVDAASTFSRLLEVARLGATGETYAFSREGRLLSPSRFEDQLREIGLLSKDPRVRSFMNIEVRDPGVDLTRGRVPELPLLARPLTRMAAAAVAGEEGMDLEGYRDYRGVEVVGAWRWLDSLDLGIATEIDRDEAYAALAPVRARTYGLLALLGLAALGLLVYSIAIRRVHGDLAAARRLGRYRIEAVLGRGGMGTVYRARHALLRRPTAIKVLRPEHVSRESIARFEREVQVTSQLTHPNTIEIFDYGQTPENLFYYAMEYLDGATLRAVVDRSGRMPEARALPILRQLCGSIAEAHRIAMVHRDIKPSNVMLCDRGGLLDFVKVLDFGLVKPFDGRADVDLTDSRAMTGTPLYMPPELIRSPDALGPRSDVYQIGAVGWFLLAGRHLFEGASAVEVLEQHLNAEARPPSEVAGVAVDATLEALLMRCVEKEPADRPADAGELLAALDAITLASVWTHADAVRFWAEWKTEPRGADDLESDPMPIRTGDSLDIGPRVGDAASH